MIDGEWLCARDDGRVDLVSDDERTPFAVVLPFRPTVEAEIGACESFDEMSSKLDALPPRAECAAVRIDGAFPRLSLRCMPRQREPYRPLAQIAVTAERFVLSDAVGTVLGFRFPDALQSIETPGYHLHFVSADRTRGGHVLDLEIADGASAKLDVSSELHLEVPVGLPMPEAHPDEEGRALLRQVEND